MLYMAVTLDPSAAAELSSEARVAAARNWYGAGAAGGLSAKHRRFGRKWMNDPTLGFELMVACGLAIAAAVAAAIVVGVVEVASRLL